MLDQIKANYKIVRNKNKFIRELAEYFHMSPLSIRNHWFSNHWAIPEYKQERCLLFLENYLHKQSKNRV